MTGGFAYQDRTPETDKGVKIPQQSHNRGFHIEGGEVKEYEKG
jgi:hypothetical protein